MTIEEAAALKSNVHATFDSPQGKETMLFLEKIGGWYPTMFDTNETNDIVARDANRKLIGTIKTILALTPEQIIALVNKE
jgi:hypothetical protein